MSKFEVDNNSEQLQLIKFNEEVYYLEQSQNFLSQQHYQFLKTQANKNPRTRCRICTHQSPDALLHEMFILQKKGNYILPHLHSKSDESILVLSGEGTLVYFDRQGLLVQIIHLNSDIRHGVNYVRVPQGQYHSLFITSEEFLFKETVLGPFNRPNMVEASWAPKESDLSASNQFMLKLQDQFNQMEVLNDS